MQGVRWAGLVVGVLVVTGTLASALRTLVVPRGYTSRLNRALSRGIWGFFLALARRAKGYEAKDNVLVLVAPVFLIVLLVSWLVLLLLGFGLVLWPFMGDGIGGALRESGSALFTLGFAGAPPGAQTVINFVAAASGLGVSALLIAYLPTLYSAFNRREMLVTMLESRAGAPAWGPELLARQQLVDIVDDLAAFYADWERWAADVTETHTSYPVLVFFRSAHELQSWIGGLLAVLDSAAIYLAIAPSEAPSSARLCLRMGFTGLRRIADLLNIPYEVDPHPDDPIDLTFEEFQQGLQHIARVGWEFERTPEEAWAHFRGWRVNYESVAYALADRIVAPPALWSGTRRHLPGPPMAPWRPPQRAPGKDDA
jgi:hypothetical protein